MRFRFQLAGSEHEAGLRRILAEEAMPGAIRLAYTREPDFFAGLALEGPFTQAFVALEQGEPVAMGTRAVRTLLVNGAPEAVGYLGGLRARPRVRGHLGLSRGYAILKQEHQDGRCQGYLSTILEDNEAARSLLTAGRSGLPTYRDLGGLWSHLLLVKRSQQPVPGVRRAEAEDLARVLTFLAEHGPERQFFPALAAEDFGQPWLHGLRVEDFWLLERGGTLRALLAVWDQRSRRQFRVQGYAPWLRVLRPGINPILRLGGLAPLPAPGRAIALAQAAFLRVAGDAPGDLQALLRGTLASLAGGDLMGLAIVLHERDPLRPAVKGFLNLAIRSRLYGVGWEDASPWFQALDPSRVPYLDATLL